MAARTWASAGADVWSNPAAWDGGVSVPAAGDTITFDGTAVGDCTMDDLGTWGNAGPAGTETLTISTASGGYTGVISQNVAINIGLFQQNKGTWNQAAAFAVKTFNLGNGAGSTLAWNGGSQAVTIAGNVQTNTGAGITWKATSGTTTLSNSTVFNQNGGAGGITFDANGGTFLIIGTSNFTTFIAPGMTFNLIVVNKASGTMTFSSTTTTIPLGANPTTRMGDGTTLTFNGTVKWSGPWTHYAGSVTLGNAGTATSTSSPALKITEGSFTVNAGTVLTNAFDVTMNITSATARTFAGAGKTYGIFRRTGDGSGQLTISGSNTFTTFRDNEAGAAHTILMTAGTTQTAGSYILPGPGTPALTMRSTVDDTPWTLTTTGGQVAGHLILKDSTVDVSPKWFARVPSTNLGGNTNWLFDKKNVPPMAVLMPAIEGALKKLNG